MAEFTERASQCLLANCSMESPFYWKESVFSTRFLLYARWKTETCVYLSDDWNIAFSSHHLTFCLSVYCISGKSPLNLVLFSNKSNIVFSVYLHSIYGMIFSWGLLCAEHSLVFLSRIPDVGSRLTKRILNEAWQMLARWFVNFTIWPWFINYIKSKIDMRKILQEIKRFAELKCFFKS